MIWYEVTDRIAADCIARLSKERTAMLRREFPADPDMRQALQQAYDKGMADLLEEFGKY